MAYRLHCLSPAEKGLAHAREGWETRPPATRPEDNADGLHKHFPFVYLEHQTSFPLTVSVRLRYSGTSFFYLNVHSLKLDVQHCFY